MNVLNEPVAVTGAAGGIGRVLSEHLARQGPTVFGLDLRTDRSPPPDCNPSQPTSSRAQES
jgi:nucleoside-diphosphate-sugar epimerase